MVFIKRQGDRLSRDQRQAIQTLKGFEIKIEIALITIDDEIIRIEGNNLDRVRIPSKRDLQINPISSKLTVD